MKLLASILIWLAALLLAAWLLYRLFRRRPVLVQGRVGRRAVRVAAVVLVGLGLGVAATESPRRSAVAQNQEENANEDAGAAPQGLPDTARRQAVPEDPDAARQFMQNYALHLIASPRNQGASYNFAEYFVGAELRRLQDPQLGHEFGENLRDMPGLTAIMTDALGPPHAERALQYTAADVAAALDEICQPEKLHPRLNAYLWGKLMALPAPATDEQAEAYALALYRVERNARLIHAVIRAERQVGYSTLFALFNANFRGRAWMSKAGPSPLEIQRQQQLAALTQAQAERLAHAVERFRLDEDAGAWESEGLVLLGISPNSAPVQVVHPRSTEVMRPGVPTRIGRLDLIRTGPGGGRLVSDWLGEIELPQSATLRVIDLSALLDEAQRERIAETIETVVANQRLYLEAANEESEIEPAQADAARNAADAGLLLLERNMPFAYPQLREATGAPQIGAAWPALYSFNGTTQTLYSFWGQPELPPSGHAELSGLKMITQLFDESVFVATDGTVQPYGYTPLQPTSVPEGFQQDR